MRKCAIDKPPVLEAKERQAMMIMMHVSMTDIVKRHIGRCLKLSSRFVQPFPALTR
jgi:hypothetical protein